MWSRKGVSPVPEVRDGKRWLTVDEIAARPGITRRSVYKLARREGWTFKDRVRHKRVLYEEARYLRWERERRKRFNQPGEA